MKRIISPLISIVLLVFIMTGLIPPVRVFAEGAAPYSTYENNTLYYFIPISLLGGRHPVLRPAQYTNKEKSSENKIKDSDYKDGWFIFVAKGQSPYDFTESGSADDYLLFYNVDNNYTVENGCYKFHVLGAYYKVNSAGIRKLRDWDPSGALPGRMTGGGSNKKSGYTSYEKRKKALSTPKQSAAERISEILEEDKDAGYNHAGQIGFTGYEYELTGTEHSFSACTATCTEPGMKVCGICGYTEYCPALGHSYTVTQSPATCTYPAVIRCERCTSVITRGSALGHAWDGGAITIDPTVYDNGTKTFTCTRSGCGATRTEPVPHLPFQIFSGDKRVEKIYLGTGLIFNAASGSTGLVK